MTSEFVRNGTLFPRNPDPQGPLTGQSFMQKLLRGCVLAVILGSPLLVVGCGEDNEKTANIKGSGAAAPGAPTSQADPAYSRGTTADLKSQGYPGTGGKR
jgi:hypothetical protein